MLGFLGGLLDGIPPLAKELILLVLGIIFIRAAWAGGRARDMAFGVAK